MWSTIAINKSIGLFRDDVLIGFLGVDTAEAAKIVAKLNGAERVVPQFLLWIDRQREFACSANDTDSLISTSLATEAAFEAFLDVLRELTKELTGSPAPGIVPVHVGPAET